jgi:hypothetical protein
VTKDSRNTSAVPLTLDTELRLLPQQLSLGKAELLTDALILPFTDIENRLGHYALSSSETEMKQLAKRMKNYLGRLNANPHIPLKFRLNVLNRFEQELDLFDAEMTAAILNAHKIGVMLVQEAARNHSDYYPTLVDMIANAIELAIKLLLIDLEQYRAPSVIVTRQFFDLARLGLDVSAAMGDAAPSKTSRLHKAVCKHEILRKIDFFSHPRARQQQIWQELQCHIGALTPRLYRADDALASTDIHHGSASLMLINLNRPNDPGRIIRQLPGPIEYDCIVISLDKLTERLNKAIHSVEAVLLDPHMQKTALHTEQALESALIGGQAMLAALQDDKRTTQRSGHAEARIQIHFDLPKAFIKAFTSTASPQASHQPATWDQTKAWSMIDFNQAGICLERMHAESMSELPGHLVGLDWQFGENSPQRVFIAWKEGMDKQNQPLPALGFIRWAKTMKAGEQRIGIEFFDPGFKLAKAIISGGDQGMDDKRTWPVLIQPGTSSHQMIFPATKAYKHMTFKVLLGKKQAYFKIRSVLETGQNYSLCDIIRATLK